VSKPIKVFLCPSDPESGRHSPHHTNYVGIAGTGSDAASLPLSDARCGIFGYDRTVRARDVEDGTANTLLFLETRRETGPWAGGGPATVRGIDPEDKPPIGPVNAFGVHLDEWRRIGWQRLCAMAAMADGSVRTVPATVSAEVLAALATIAGGEAVKMDW
jgi:hypothetical protein